MKKKKKPTEAQRRAWVEARIANYVNTRSTDALTRMVVELEEEYRCIPEFEIDAAWPEYVAHMRVK